jgi:ADP-glucose pyrophosphorylase
MPDVGIWCKNANIQARAGTGANSTAKATAATDVYVLDAEALINCLTRKNWSDAYASLNVDVKYILMDAAASYCANIVISYDFSGYSSKVEAQTLIDINRDNFVRDIEVLKDLKNQDFITGA